MTVDVHTPMPLKGKKNHYNVKLLKSYGASVLQKNKQISLKDGKDPFAR